MPQAEKDKRFKQVKEMSHSVWITYKNITLGLYLSWKKTDASTKRKKNYNHLLKCS